ncbi:MAG: cyanophycinase, partial [Bacteroidetes bacterium]|nr:cyanophycinase [Bacteroidota bacterium]
KKDGNDAEAIERIKTAHAVFFTGGDQEKLVNHLYDTKLLATIKKKYHDDKNFIVGGTSAGAMAMPETIILGGIIREALFTADIKMSEGLALIKDVIVDTHFIKRGRFGRLAHAVTLNPTCLGIGLGENTALIISNGNESECIGSGMIILIDGSHIVKTNIVGVDDSTPIIIENLRVSIIAEGSKCLLRA